MDLSTTSSSALVKPRYKTLTCALSGDSHSCRHSGDLRATGDNRTPRSCRIKDTAQVAPFSLTGQVRIVRRGTDADGLSGAGKEVAHIMRSSRVLAALRKGYGCFKGPL